jgi:hypothetical protein
MLSHPIPVLPALVPPAAELTVAGTAPAAVVAAVVLAAAVSLVVASLRRKDAE